MKTVLRVILLWFATVLAAILALAVVLSFLFYGSETRDYKSPDGRYIARSNHILGPAMGRDDLALYILRSGWPRIWPWKRNVFTGINTYKFDIQWASTDTLRIISDTQPEDIVTRKNTLDTIRIKYVFLPTAPFAGANKLWARKSTPIILNAMNCLKLSFDEGQKKHYFPSDETAIIGGFTQKDLTIFRKRMISHNDPCTE